MLSALTHGWPGLAFNYATVHAPMLFALARNRAQWSRWAWSPLWAVPMTIAAGVGAMVTEPFVRTFGFANTGFLQFAVDAGVSAAVGYLGGRMLAQRSSEDSSHRRGTLIEDAREPPRPRRSRDHDASNAAVRGNATALTLAGLRIPLADETKHFKFIGTTGTGKSTAISEVLRGALRRGDRAIIADPDGGYMRRFYDESRGDVILNPFEPKSAKWDLYGEIANDYDVEQVARSLIPDREGSDRSWREYARTFFTAVVQQTHSIGARDVREAYRLLVMAGTDELKVLLRGTPAQPFLEDQNARMFDSVRSVTASAVGALQYISKQDGSELSVRDWVNEGKGVLFIPYRAGQIAALRSQISAWMRLAIFETMNGAEGDRRLWFAVDELDALGQIDGLKDALARVRKFGGRCLLGLQSIAQVSGTYGRAEAQTIVENCGNTAIFRCGGSENGGTSQFASRLIGQREVMRTTESRSRRFMQWMPAVTRSEHVNIEPAVLDSEIEQLPDLRAYLKLASDPSWRRVALSLPQAAATSVPGNIRRLWEALQSQERDRGPPSSGASDDIER